jgi:PncC family amidohydrolase
MPADPPANDREPSSAAASDQLAAVHPLARRVADLLNERDQVLVLAEGATGGFLAHVLTQVPGSSRWLRAGIVAYTDHPKQLLLRVSDETIAERGAISPEATVQMARLARRLFTADWALAVTGYADESPATAGARAHGVPRTNPPGVPVIPAEKTGPVAGLTYLAVSGRRANAEGDTQSWEEWHLPAADRTGYKLAAAEAAMELLVKTLEA